MDLREVGYDDRDWINLAQDRDRWRAYYDKRIPNSALWVVSLLRSHVGRHLRGECWGGNSDIDCVAEVTTPAETPPECRSKVNLRALHQRHSIFLLAGAEDYAARRAMCCDLCEAADRENVMGHILFTDEATFYACGRLHRHNYRIWADEIPNDTMEWERHSPKVNVWLGLTKRKVYGPYMFAEQTITGDIYLDMLQLFLHPQLLRDGIIDTVVLQQDGAPPHFALTVRAYLNDMFPNRWIGRASPRIWTPRSPDFTPLDFFAWGFIKQQVYRTKVPNLQVLKERIRQASAMITDDMLVNVFQATVRRWETCFEIDAGHVDH
ncbi:hypothetical protein ANN_00183 [Periplaneta americana]|uniref:Transposable element Tc3 transposase n=1 Tax=Periplaneta americana TaxID=6978 RepID=A0ABQ8TRW4_PERAM|nr:hypothetical protein ANN_00183 [Periplaneta americana]